MPAAECREWIGVLRLGLGWMAGCFIPHPAADTRDGVPPKAWQIRWTDWRADDRWPSAGAE